MRSRRLPPPYLSPLQPGRGARRRRFSGSWVLVVVLVALAAAFALRTVGGLPAGVVALVVLAIVAAVVARRPFG